MTARTFPSQLRKPDDVCHVSRRLLRPRAADPARPSTPRHPNTPKSISLVREASFPHHPARRASRCESGALIQNRLRTNPHRSAIPRKSAVRRMHGTNSSILALTGVFGLAKEAVARGKRVPYVVYGVVDQTSATARRAPPQFCRQPRHRLRRRLDLSIDDSGLRSDAFSVTCAVFPQHGDPVPVIGHVIDGRK